MELFYVNLGAKVHLFFEKCKFLKNYIKNPDDFSPGFIFNQNMK